MAVLIGRANFFVLTLTKGSTESTLILQQAIRGLDCNHASLQHSKQACPTDHS